MAAVLCVVCVVAHMLLFAIQTVGKVERELRYVLRIISWTKGCLHSAGILFCVRK